MKTAWVLACCLLVFPLIGTVSKSGPKARTQSPANEDADARRTGAEQLTREASAHFQAGRYQDALRKFQAARAVALVNNLPCTAARALGNIGAAQFALHQYRPALQTFLDARRQADAAGDHSAAAMFGVNTASLYSELGDLDAAAEWIQGTLMQRLDQRDRRNLPRILIQLATLRARQDRMDEARSLFQQGIHAAAAAADLALYANGWNRLGEEYLKRGELALAEPPLLEAYRIRKLNHLALDVSYRSLGRLRLEQGDLTSASALLGHAVELSAQPTGSIPTWDTYHYRGRVRLAQGRLPEALADLRIAVQLARDWRWNMPPDDAARMGIESWLELVHAALVEAGNRLYLQTHDPALIRETFEAAEENRAISLRAVASRGRTPDAAALPPAYWEMLAQLQRAEVQALRSADPRAQDSVATVRAELVRMELALGPAAAPPLTAVLKRTRSALDERTALLSFQLGDNISWLWALDRDGVALYALPPRAQVEAEARDAAHAIRENLDGGPGPGQLWRTLFGAMAPRFHARERWLISLDRGSTLTSSQSRFTAGGLPFEAPLAALRDSSRQPVAYLAERHVIEMIPGAGYWLEAMERPRAAYAPLFVGVGDAIYNMADPRLARPASPARKTQPLVLPRLVGSAAEIDACARAWQGERVLLKGADASRQALVAQLGRNPAVLHLATHVVESSERPSYGLIGLSLTPQLENQFLPPFEIAGWRTNAELVVLSGCNSAAGARLPGSGLLGLTRAWLMAGAHAVIGSNWATPDESGALFGALYGNLSGERDASPAAALRAAQLAMLRSGGWHAKPSYWGAYFVVGSQ
ncbi:MAG: CHAT domain-containing protein [Candidatus Solibacter sp.]